MPKQFYYLYSATVLCTYLLLPGLLFARPCSNAADNTTIPDIKLTRVAEGLEDPVAITNANDGSGRLFVLEQDGLVRVIKNQQLLPEPLLDIRDRVISGGETGLLGIAFHPQFKQNGRFFLDYTTEQQGITTVIAEFQVDTNGIARASSEKVLLTIKQPWENHNGGQLAFGPDGYLYIALGDGGLRNDPKDNGQNRATLLGSILRIDIDHPTDKRPYGIPADNPFIHQKDMQGEIWAYGLRNPWRFSFDRLTGELYVADVGQNAVEEINIVEKGKNYGWRIMEGPICTPGVNKQCSKDGLTLPIYSYTHDTGRAITGGYVYRGNKIPALCGTYIYGDFVNQAIWGLRYQDGKVINHKTLFEAKSLLRLIVDYFDDDALLISTFGEDEAGEIYVAAYQSGRIYRIDAK